MPIREDGSAFPLMTDGLLGAISSELTASGLPGLCFVGALPGAAIAMDYIESPNGCGGMLWVRLNTMFPSSDFPFPDTTGQTGIYAMEFEVGLLRNAPTLDGRNRLPTVEHQLDATRIQLADMAAMRRAICAYLQTNNRTFAIGVYTPVGPEGGALGGGWTVTVQEEF